MSRDTAHLYFTKCNLFEITEILLRLIDTNKEDVDVLEKTFWEGVLQFQHAESVEGSVGLLQHGWQQSWIAIRLLHILQNKTSVDITTELDETPTSLRREASFISLSQSLDCLTADECKTLKALFDRISFSNSTSGGKVLPKLTTSTENALLKSLVEKPGETHLLLKLLSCNHEAFVGVTKGVNDLYASAVMQCLHNISHDDVQLKKRTLNVLYVLLLLLPTDKNANEVIGRALDSQSQSGVLELTPLLSVLSCHGCRDLYTYLSACQDTRMLRHVDCSSTVDKELLTRVFNLITNKGQLSLEELCLRVISSKCHWVEELIGMATEFAIIQDREKLDTLVGISALWPVLAVNLWKQLSTRADVLDIVNPIIDTCQRYYPDMFGSLYETIARLKVMTDWLSASDVGLPDINVMLSLIRNHSTLYVLQSTTHFVGLNHEQLRELLLQLEGPTSWNIRVFEGFTILFSAFQILIKAVDIFNQFAKEESVETMYLKYNEEVGKAILDLNESINKIEPLDFRIELLEDIFLLLFIRSEDFSEDKIDESSSDETHDEHFPLARSASDGLKSAFLPSPLQTSTPCYSVSSSSYPTSSHRKYSSHSRRGSKSSLMKLNQGFVCYPWLVRDILNCLKGSLEYSQTLCDNIDCDRLHRLEKSVLDALWRLDMLAVPDNKEKSTIGLDFPKEIGESWVYTGGDSSDSDSPFSNPPSPVHKKKRLKKVESASKSESGSNVVSSGVKFSSSASSVKGKNSKLFSTSSSLINLMLASPVSLASHFIEMEDLERATKVVQVLNSSSSLDIFFEFKKSPPSLNCCLIIRLRTAL